jgi:hypothetical protein
MSKYFQGGLHMTRYRFRGICLLFLMGHATACAGGSSSWQSPGLSPSLDSADVSRSFSLARYIEAAQPDQVRITTEDRTQYLLYSPSVESDEIVSSDGLSVPIADIVNLEIWDETDGWSPFAIVGGIILIPVALIILVIAAWVVGSS